MDRKTKLWNLLFNEELERSLDPNKVENQVRIKIEKEREAERVRKLKGGIFYDKLEKEIRNGILLALKAPATTNCGCPTCQMIRSINTLVEFWLALESIQEKGEMKNGR